METLIITWRWILNSDDQETVYDITLLILQVLSNKNSWVTNWDFVQVLQKVTRIFWLENWHGTWKLHNIFQLLNTHFPSCSSISVNEAGLAWAPAGRCCRSKALQSFIVLGRARRRSPYVGMRNGASTCRDILLHRNWVCILILYFSC